MLIDLILVLLVIAGLVFVKKLIQLKNDRKKASDEIARTKLTRLSPIGSVRQLSILPLIDFYANPRS